MNIRLLYFDGCPNWRSAAENTRTALRLEKLDWPVETVKVAGEDEAARWKFLGSPSIHADGADLWPEDRRRYSLNCRLYPAPDGLRGSPTVSMLRRAFRDLNKE